MEDKRFEQLLAAIEDEPLPLEEVATSRGALIELRRTARGFSVKA